ncbi:MAG TPA: NADH-ubiquinone oxidoreductase-F iron-sulfur binding region domain-containing protein, partial [Micromonosporaceae bacterium]
LLSPGPHPEPLPQIDARTIRGLVAAAGLTGHGGAGFPTHRKLDATAGTTNPIVIGNGAESEPASRKDHTLLRISPHLVLDGLALAARAVGAAETHLYLPADLAASVRAALSHRPHGSVHLHPAQPGFVAGEETAVISAVAGEAAVPADKLHRNAATLVQNVETLAHLAQIVRHGPDWFRNRGTRAEPGTFLATLSGPIHRPGVYEFPYGLRLGEILDAAGGPAEPLQAVLVGGYHGAWIPASPDIEISRAGLARYDASPGAGILAALPATACGLVASARAIGYLARSRAGQCGPCLNGLPAIADTFAALAELRPAPTLVTDIDRLSKLVIGRGACRHPDGTARLARSSLRMFALEVSAHLSGWCTATATRPMETVA